MYVQILEERIAQAKDSAFGEAINALESFSKNHLIQLFYFGGFIRDLYLQESPKDIDIITTMSHDFVISHLDLQHIRKNSQGGLKATLHGTNVDIWEYETSTTFTKGYLYPLITDVAKTTRFTIESVVYEVWAPVKEQKFLFEDGFFKSCQKKEVEAKLWHDFSHKDYEKAVYLCKKYGFEPGALLRSLAKRDGFNIAHYLNENVNV